ncbi:kinase-like domain-containing protein [Elsinoe ampelina]|uniref:non-specific serine/threonine protein kinase n=1 Tax=Elsinoe ampelina TaxID=302913 RepID=A0A6A6GEF2_9PEZI|nr:kinase-like domain-containing protein [Elsinoe ampelina]
MSTPNLTSYLLDALWSLTQCLSCFPTSPLLTLNSKPYKILRLLGEGGFSYVYLVQSPPSPQLYALKKIRCPFGAESVRQAMKEVEAYKLFEGSGFIINSVDHAVVADKGARSGGFGAGSGDEGAKTVYILLPYYRRGNLQDGINANLVNGSRFPERRLMVLFKGVCEGLREMHEYRVRKGGRKKARGVRREVEREGGARTGHEDREEQGEGFLENEAGLASDGREEGEVMSYAHRDIKPGNIMISDDGTTPVLMDLGSLSPSPTPITSRALALQVQDTAAEHSTMPYRAPELFDVKTDTVIDTKVDIWSLGCTLYACLVGKSPFEARSEETGGSLSLCVLGGDWRFPDDDANGSVKSRGKQAVSPGGAGQANGSAEGARKGAGISESVKEVVRKCLRVEPSERPDVGELIRLVDEVIEGLPEDENGVVDD